MPWKKGKHTTDTLGVLEYKDDEGRYFVIWHSKDGDKLVYHHGNTIK